MFNTINQAYREAKSARRANQAIIESVIGETEILGGDDEFDEVVDVDSVPDYVYEQIDKALDKIVDSPDYDDTEVEELLDSEDSANDDSNPAELTAVIEECAKHLTNF